MKSKIYFMLVMTKFFFPVVLIGLLMTGCWWTADHKEIKYEVTGTASSVYIIMHNESSSVEELDEVSLPWYKEFTAKAVSNPEEPGECAHLSYISARNNGNSGNITVVIYVNGKERRRATSSGNGVTATASGIFWVYCGY